MTAKNASIVSNKLVEVLHHPAQVFGQLSDQVTAFETRLQDAQNERLASIAAQKLKFEQRLDSQRRGIAQLNTDNLRIGSAISSYQRMTKRKRNRIDELRHENTNLRSDFTILLANLTSAKEFTASCLHTDQTGGDLEVLSLLTRQEKVRNAVEAKRKFWEKLHVQSLQGVSGSLDGEDGDDDDFYDLGGAGDPDDEVEDALEDNLEGEEDEPDETGVEGEKFSKSDSSELDGLDAEIRELEGEDSFSETAWDSDDGPDNEADTDIEPDNSATMFLQLPNEHDLEPVQLPDPMELLKDMHHNLDNLDQVHNRSAIKLHEIFMSQYNKGDEQRQSLLAEQARLNKTRGEFQALMPRLAAAETHLVSMRRYLTHQLHALRAFLASIGRTPDASEANRQRAQANDGAGAILLQVKGGGISTTSAAPTEGEGKLPLLSDMLTASFDTYRTVDTKAGMLEEHLLDMEEQAKVALLDAQLSNENALMQQNRESLRAAKTNTNIASDIHTYKQLNQQLQSRARLIQGQNMAIRRDLHNVQANIAVSIAFAQNALAHSDDHKAPVLNVLKELLDRDVKEAAEQAEKERFLEIANPWMGVYDTDTEVPVPVLLQVAQDHNQTPAKKLAALGARSSQTLQARGSATDRSSHTTDKQKRSTQSKGNRKAVKSVDEEKKNSSALSPTQMLSQMEANLHKLRAAHAESEDTLNLIFERAYTQGKDRLAALYKEQAALNHTLLATAHLTPKLKAALAQVEAIHMNLTNNDLAVKRYLARLSRSGEAQTVVEAEDLTSNYPPQMMAANGPPSLLQMTSRVVRRTHSSKTAATKTASEEEGPEIHSKAYTTMTSRAAALQEKLSEMETTNQEDLNAKASEYSRRLQMVKRKTRDLVSRASDMEKENKQIDARNAALRRKASVLQADRAKLTADLQDIARILSTAEEFTAYTLANSSTTSPELGILSELDEKDRAQSMKDDKMSRMSEIAAASHSGSRLGLLQTGRDNPKSLLAVLEGGLDDLAKEHEEKEQSLRADFEKEIKERYAQYKAAEERIANLQEARQTALKLQARLQTAVKHLEDKCNMLQVRAQSMRAFADRLAKRPVVKTSPPDVEVVETEEVPAFAQAQQNLLLKEGDLTQSNLRKASEATVPPGAAAEAPVAENGKKGTWFSRMLR